MHSAPRTIPTAPGPRFPTFRSLGHRNYRLYFFGQIVSFTGSWMQNAALMWLVFEATSDPLWPPLLLVAQVGPTILLGPLGGSLADRFSKRRVVYASQFAFLMSSLVIAALVMGNAATPWVLFAFNLCNGVIQAVDLPARLALVPDLVPKADLINAVSLNSLVFNAARAVGPSLAGALFLAAGTLGPIGGYAPLQLGALGCILANSLSYIAVLMALRRIRIAEGTGERGPASSMLDGIRYLRSRPALVLLLLLTGGLCVFGWPALTLFPAYTKLVLGMAEKEYTTLVSSLGIGALVAALVNATFGTARRSGRMLFFGALTSALGLFALSGVHELWPALAGGVLLGFGLILFLSTGQSRMQLSVPDAVRGRAMAFWAMTLSASAPIGHIAAGSAAQMWPIPEVLMVLGCGASIVAAGVWLLARFSQPEA